MISIPQKKKGGGLEARRPAPARELRLVPLGGSLTAPLVNFFRNKDRPGSPVYP